MARKEEVMGQMSWLAYLVESGDEQGLIEFLSGKGFKNPGFAAKEFLKANDEIKEDKAKKADNTCQKCESDHPVHTTDDLSDGNYHKVKDGSTTIIPDPFAKEKKDVK